MKIVINIPKEEYDEILSSEDCGLHTLTRAVVNGTPLPKGHGRLIDADVLADGREEDYELCEAINATPTIIEADGGEDNAICS